MVKKKETSETAQTLPVMKAVTADPASMAKSELERLREENRQLKGMLVELQLYIEKMSL